MDLSKFKSITLTSCDGIELNFKLIHPVPSYALCILNFLKFLFNISLLPTLLTKSSDLSPLKFPQSPHIRSRQADGTVNSRKLTPSHRSRTPEKKVIKGQGETLIQGFVKMMEFLFTRRVQRLKLYKTETWLKFRQGEKLT